MAAPNIVNVTTIIGKTAVLAATTTPTAIVTNAADSGKVFKLNSVIAANIDGTNAADITVELFRSSVAYPIAKTITVPADATLVVLSKETAMYLEEGDAIRVQASANGDLQVTCSYEEIS
jgi:hypothetical protein